MNEGQHSYLEGSSKPAHHPKEQGPMAGGLLLLATKDFPGKAPATAQNTDLEYQRVARGFRKCSQGASTPQTHHAVGMHTVGNERTQISCLLHLASYRLHS